MKRLDGKVAFITGGGSGIARAASVLFAREGAKVAVAEIDGALGAATARNVADAGGDAMAVRTDVTDESSVRAAIDTVVARHGRLDILFNCAGGSLNADSLVTDVDLDVWDRTMGLDVRGAMLVCRHGIPELVKAGGGSVVNMSSGAALRGSSPKHVYTAAKGAILSFTRALAGTYAKDNIRANAICAGRILTDRILNNYGTADAPGPVADRQDAAGRVRDYPFWVGRPEDIANIALFLASDESRMITGATIPADGGRSAY
ncbi:MAG: SDR family oxidoreductase [Rhodocyclaceae bacterium]|nr:SDR family oxidoreductase [Rhodocyclaceae bacterium]MCE2980464.1 SDR family oxidoreductase [Betaproteobacteria bacterium]MCA3075774.1 SDR family oxidoreductase [Rhodocyclaceae bacterium]MCA3091555.1 SDR family oxidoreductase [Rhodocyclaceae bacterium]MCA3094077.1 SDR family oxidoreductase [Rhodocyclaceae bacterium]